MKIFDKKMSKDEKLMSIKALFLNLLWYVQKYRKFSSKILRCLHDGGIYDYCYDGILLQETLNRIENCESVFIGIKVEKEDLEIYLGPSKKKKLKSILRPHLIKDNGLKVAVVFDDDEYCQTAFINERKLRGEYLGTILNTPLGKKVMEMCGNSRKEKK